MRVLKAVCCGVCGVGGLVVFGAALAGCGAGSGHTVVDSTAGGSRSAATGRAAFTVKWPARAPATSRLIPSASNSIQVSLVQSGTVVATQLLARPNASSGSAQVATATFNSVPVGAYTVSATAFPNADGSGVAQATGSVTITVSANATANFSLTMATTISQIHLNSATSGIGLPATLGPGATLDLSASAVDGAGDVVLANLAWSAVNPATGAASTVASVSSAGVVTALGVGSAKVTVTDPDTGKSASTTVTVGYGYTAVDIGVPRSGFTFQGTAAMNASGQVASTWNVASTTVLGSLVPHAFLYTPGGGFVDMGTLGTAAGITTTGIDASGDVVGTAQIGANSTVAVHAFLYGGGAMRDIGTLGGPPPDPTFATAVNASGQIVGTSQTSAGTLAFLDTNGTLQPLGNVSGGTATSPTAINASGQIVGSFDTGVPDPIAGDVLHAFLYSGGALTDLGVLSGYTDTQATGINASGVVVGTAANGSLLTSVAPHGFVYSGGKMQSLETLAGVTVTSSAPTAINDGGLVVGAVTTPNTTLSGSPNAYAFVYSNGVLQNLNSVTTGLNGFTLQTAFAVTNNGLILAEGADNAGDLHLFVLTP